MAPNLWKSIPNGCIEDRNSTTKVQNRIGKKPRLLDDYPIWQNEMADRKRLRKRSRGIGAKLEIVVVCLFVPDAFFVVNNLRPRRVASLELETLSVLCLNRSAIGMKVNAISELVPNFGLEVQDSQSASGSTCAIDTNNVITPCRNMKLIVPQAMRQRGAQVPGPNGHCFVPLQQDK